MAVQRMNKVLFPVVLIFDMIIIVLSWYNIVAMREAAQFPAEYLPPGMSMEYRSEIEEAPRAIQSLDGRLVVPDANLRFVLSQYRQGDSVVVTEITDNILTQRSILLLPKFSAIDIISSVVVGLVFLLFGLYVVIRHRSKPYATVLHALTVGTAIMVLYDWGSLAVHSTLINFTLRLLFDCAVWLIPSLFLHFSFIYPNDNQRSKRLLLTPWYAVSFAGIALSVWYLIMLFAMNIPVQDTWYMELHGTVNDVFLLAGLLCTVGKFEHSALNMQDARQRKDVYWVLLGIMFGPLVYVFMILVPRTLLGYELVSNSVMQYTLIIAPLMFWKVIRK